MNTTPTSAFTVDEVLKASWAMTKKHWLQFLALLFAMVAMFVAFDIVYGILDKLLSLPNDIANILERVLSFLLNVFVLIFLVRGILTIARKQKLDLATLLKVDGKTYLHAVLATIVFYIAVVVGLVMLIVPGIIAAIMFGFYMYSIVDKKTDAIQSLEDSMAMTRGNKLTIFLVNLILFLLSLVLFAVCIALVLVPMSVSNAVASGSALMMVVGIAFLVVAVAGFITLSMVSMSAQAYMYDKMRAKNPLHIKR